MILQRNLSIWDPSHLYRRRKKQKNVIIFVLGKITFQGWKYYEEWCDFTTACKVIYTSVDGSNVTATSWEFSTTSLVSCMWYLKARWKAHTLAMRQPFFISPVLEVKNPSVCNHPMLKSSINKIKGCLLKSSLELSEVLEDFEVQVLKVLV